MENKQQESGRIWIKLVKGHKIDASLTLPCEFDKVQDTIREAMHELDLGMPVWLKRHQTDWENFRLTRFTQDHFMEHINFDRMEISYIAPEDMTKKPKFTEY